MKMPHVISLSVLAGISAFVISLTGVAAENWPDSVDQYIEQIRKTIDTTDMDGYLAVVKNPNGALLLDGGKRGENGTRARHGSHSPRVSRTPDLEVSRLP